MVVMSIEMIWSEKKHFCQEIREGHVLKEVEEVNMKANHGSPLFRLLGCTPTSHSLIRVTVFEFKEILAVLQVKIEILSLKSQIIF